MKESSPCEIHLLMISSSRPPHLYSLSHSPDRREAALVAQCSGERGAFQRIPLKVKTKGNVAIIIGRPASQGAGHSSCPKALGICLPLSRGQETGALQFSIALGS